MLQSTDVRTRFLEYFQRNGHEVVSSSSLVPQNDPTLLFTNAGMVQFKDVFTGRERRGYRRATSAQKCVRAGGKHNDLENVGRTARHQTFFEMLGNFSFGDYFKADAIRFAWDLLTNEYGVRADRLMVTVFAGDGEMNLPPDEEARALWRSVAGLDERRIVGLGAKDNFWQMGDTGPCGPCSEIHYHLGDDIPCPEAVCKGPACDCDRWLEIWNLVFMQFERDRASTLTALPAPSVDTGMGLERVTAVLQGVRSNYETDLFTPLIAEIQRISEKPFDPADFAGPSVSMRAIADHARATAFLIADGVMPEKTGREYVLRRIMRRAIYHGWLLGIPHLFLHRIADAVVDYMGEVYPELRARRPTILEMTQVEERKFRETLERGMRILEEEFDRVPAGGQLSGDVAFRLYDTFGFPLDLTQVIAEARGASVDIAAYDTAMAEQRRRSSFVGSGEEAVEEVYKRVRAAVAPSEFLGHETASAEGSVLRVIVGGQEVEEAGPGPVGFVADRTPFYGEQGGQIGDTGLATGEAGLEVRVTDTRKPGGDLIVHVGEVVSGRLRAGARVRLEVDVERRDAIRKNHSATHLVHWALRQVLGEHVAQKGSVVAADRLRFDFSHTRPLSAGERQRVEELVNQRVWLNDRVRTEVLPIDQAMRSGAVAFFGEKYGDRVRVVQMAESREFCGGTHVQATGDIGLFKIVEESGIAQGVRRIVAVTGPGALQYVQSLEETLGQVAERVRGSGPDVVEKVERLREEARALQRQVDDLQRKLASGGARDLIADLQEVGGIKVLATRAGVADPRAMREVGDQLKDRMGSGVVVLAGVDNGNVSLLAMVTRDLVGWLQANRILDEIAPLVGGRGGGRPELAQAGGTRPESVDAALAEVPGVVERAGRLRPD